MPILFQYRNLLRTLTVHRISVRYKQSALGIAWAILQPLSLMLIYTVIFSVFTRVPVSNDVPYPIFVYSALLPWTFFSTALTNASNGLINHTQLITKVYFPREIIPLTYVIAALFDFLIASVIMVGLMAFYRMPLTPEALWTIPALFIGVVFSTALALIFSAVQVRFRDVGLAMPLLMQIWTFATPVVYPLSAVPLRYRTLYELNPMVGVIENFRRSLLHIPLDMASLARSAFIALALLPLGYLFFKNREATMADIL